MKNYITFIHWCCKYDSYLFRCIGAAGTKFGMKQGSETSSISEFEIAKEDHKIICADLNLFTFLLTMEYEMYFLDFLFIFRSIISSS